MCSEKLIPINKNEYHSRKKIFILTRTKTYLIALEDILKGKETRMFTFHSLFQK